MPHTPKHAAADPTNLSPTSLPEVLLGGATFYTRGPGGPLYNPASMAAAGAGAAAAAVDHIRDSDIEDEVVGGHGDDGGVAAGHAARVFRRPDLMTWSRPTVAGLKSPEQATREEFAAAVMRAHQKAFTEGHRVGRERSVGGVVGAGSCWVGVGCAGEAGSPGSAGVEPTVWGIRHPTVAIWLD